ncbi:hypothetical protein [Clostridium beijerinckii]|nr:hypothetical protein [Clostridium beijerinckii]NRT27675.1 hypothetical protein [Clostridium beijerinckii]NRV91883.1 hypothetical protein [Clostridium beijerinckii]NRW27568.1 hypothetical protein [Clostridium beijerinckii]NRX87374.1 hypothetical protein [Clostridium beijerinckii]NRY51602.1 hypothetical protein [Clostridium beijerinckii]
MNYTIYDLIERFIDIEKNALDVYKKLKKMQKKRILKILRLLQE